MQRSGRPKRRRRRLGHVLAALVLASAPAFGQACADFLDLGTLGGATAYGRGVSADGTIVVGVSQVSPGMEHAFRWTAETGMQPLSTLGGDHSEALAISADGSAIVGWSFDAAGLGRAVRWTSGGTAEDLGDLGGAAFAYAVSADGSVVVGRARDAANAWRAFRWTEAGGMQDLGELAPGAWSLAFAVSADGEVVSGRSDGRAFLWTRATGMRPIGSLGGSSSTAYALSDGGRLAVGAGGLPGSPLPPYHAFRWTPATGMQDLGTLGGALSTAFATTADGEVVVGGSFTGTSSSRRAFRWTEDEGMREVETLGGRAEAIDVSADGSVVIGTAYDPVTGNARAFRVRSSVVGESYCRPAVANSAGCAGTLLVEGSPRIAEGTLMLRAVDLPADSFGVFLTSPMAASVPGWSGSQGTLCLGGSPGVFSGAGEVKNSGVSGELRLSVDLTSLPTPGGTTAAMPGETWNFQAWYRDANPTVTSNLTDAVGVTVQ